MKVLIDECAPKALRTFLSQFGHECKTVQECGWSGKQNGDLLKLVEAHFDVFVTVDANVPYQQNLSDRKIRVVILIAPTNRLTDLEPIFRACAAAVEKVGQGEVFIVRGAHAK